MFLSAPAWAHPSALPHAHSDLAAFALLAFWGLAAVAFVTALVRVHGWRCLDGLSPR